VGGPFGSGLAASSIDFDSAGTAYVAVDTSPSTTGPKVELFKYGSGTWESLGSPQPDFDCYLSDLYMVSNIPYLAYGGTYEEAATYHIGAVSTYNSSDGWSAPAGGYFYEHVSYPLQALAHTRYGSDSYVAYIDNNNLYAKSFISNGWQQKLISSTVAIESGVDLAVFDTPVVAYANGDGNLTVMKLVYTSSWQEQDISPGSIRVGDSPVRLFGDNNALYLAYVGSDNDNKVSVMKFDGSNNTWTYIGSPGFSGPVATGPGTLDLYVAEGVPYIFYKNNSDSKGYLMQGPAQP
jgi:hypothetical protein